MSLCMHWDHITWDYREGQEESGRVITEGPRIDKQAPLTMMLSLGLWRLTRALNRFSTRQELEISTDGVGPHW